MGFALHSEGSLLRSHPPKYSDAAGKVTLGNEQLFSGRAWRDRLPPRHADLVK